MSAIQETATSPFEIPHEENPIKFGSKRIQEITDHLVTVDLRGVFPKNKGYMRQDYNLVYEVIEEPQPYTEGVYRNIVLTPDGKFKTGFVQGHRESYSSRFNFDNTSYTPATDLEIVRYAPHLIDDLFENINLELVDLSTIDEVEKSLKALVKQDKIRAEISGISKAALIEMGEEVEIEKDIDTNGQKLQKTVEEENLKEYKRLHFAVDLYNSHEDIARNVKEVAQRGRAREVQEEIANLTGKIVKADLFESDPEFQNGGIEEWHGVKIYEENTADIPEADHLFVVHTEALIGKTRKIAISQKGEVREFADGYFDPLPFCAEHIIDRAEEIADGLIQQTVASVLPSLRWPKKVDSEV